MDHVTVPALEASAFEHASEAFDFIAKQLPAGLQNPRLGTICGSGLGGLAATVLPQPRHEIPYSVIPHFPSVSGISTQRSSCRGCILIGACKYTVMQASSSLESYDPMNLLLYSWLVESSQSSNPLRTLACLDIAKKEDSYYEGHSFQSITFPVRVLKLLGVDTLLSMT